MFARFAPVCALVCLAACTRPARESPERPVGHARAEAPPASPVQWADVTERVGLACSNVSGGAQSLFILEAPGNGAGLFDYDRDGDLDLFVSNGAGLDIPGRAIVPGPGHRLYRNQGGWRFTDVTDEAGVRGPGNLAHGVAVGDYDNDGWLDLYVTGYGSSTLYRNLGDGRFASGTAASGLGDPKWTTSAAFADVDSDGDLDLFCANFLDVDIRTHPLLAPENLDQCAFHGEVTMCAPENYDPARDTLFRNQGDGTFHDATVAMGLPARDEGRALGALFLDIEGDGDPDLYVANDSGPNFLYENLGEGRFRDVSASSGAAVDHQGHPEGSMGVAAADLNGDGLPEVAISNWINQKNTLYVNLGGFFEDQSTDWGLVEASLPFCGWGMSLADFDNDGRGDLLVVNGTTDERIEAILPQSPTRQPILFYLNRDGRSFRDVSAAAGLSARHNARGAAFGDLDDDGDVDAVVVNKNDLPTVLENRGGERSHWLEVRTEGRASNRDGIGARVRLEAGGRAQTSEVRGAESYLSHNDLRVHFGLGDQTRVDRLVVRWPSGRTDELRDLAADRVYTVAEGSAKAASEPGLVSTRRRAR